MKPLWANKQASGDILTTEVEGLMRLSRTLSKKREKPSRTRSRTLQQPWTQVSSSCRRLPNLADRQRTLKFPQSHTDLPNTTEQLARVSAYSACEKDGVESRTGHVITLITGWAYLLAPAVGLVFLKEVNDFQLQLRRNPEGRTTWRWINQHQLQVSSEALTVHLRNSGSGSVSF